MTWELETVDIHVYPQYPIQPWYVAVRDMGFPPIGKRGRGQPASKTCWGHLVQFAARTGMMRHSVADFDYIVDCYCAGMKHTLGLSRVPDAVRKAFQFLRKALIHGIRIIDADGRIRSQVSIEAEYKFSAVPKPPRKARRAASFA